MPNNPVIAFPRERVHAENFFIDTNFGLIHEDEDILVLDKPAPLAVHPVGSYFDLNLHSLLKRDPRWADTKLHFTHRLDAETSGVIVAAKHYQAARFIGKEFQAKRVKKTYRALVFGVPPPQGLIEIPLGHDASSGFQTVRIADHENGEEAATRYRLLRSYGSAYSELEVEPLTGKTHQIRAHLAQIGHPVVGDKIYIDLEIFQRYVVSGLDETMLERVKLPRLALHAERLEFTHPRENHSEALCARPAVVYTSKPPDFMKGIKI